MHGLHRAIHGLSPINALRTTYRVVDVDKVMVDVEVQLECENVLMGCIK